MSVTSSNVLVSFSISRGSNNSKFFRLWDKACCSAHCIFLVRASCTLVLPKLAEPSLPPAPATAPAPPAPEPSLQQQTFLNVLAIERKNKQRFDKPSDPVARALVIALSDVQEVTQVDVVLRNIKLSPHAFSTLFRKLGFQRKTRAILCVYKWLGGHSLPRKTPSVFTYSSVLSALKACGEFEHFNIVLSDMQEDEIEPNLVTYNIILGAYEQQGLHSEAMAVFQKLLQKGLSPNRATFRALLRAFENPVDFHGALILYMSVNSMLLKVGMEDAKGNLKDSLSSYCCGIICQSLRAGKGPEYVITLMEMAEASLSELRARDYEEIIWACGYQERDFLVAKYALSCRSKCLPMLSAAVCNHAMRIMQKEKKWWAALEVFECMREQGPSPDADSHAIIRSQFKFLLNASRERGTARWNVQLIDKMVAHDISFDDDAWESTFLACAQKVDPVSAVQTFQRMIEGGHRPSLLCYGALLTTLKRSSLFEEAERVWVYMRKAHVKPNLKICTTMLCVYAALGKENEIQMLLGLMETMGLRFNLYTYNTLISNSAKVGDCAGALKWMKQLKAGGLQPDAITYSQLVIALSCGGQVDLAKEMCVEAKESKLTLSVSAYKSVVGACERHIVECDMNVIGVSSHVQALLYPM